MSDMDEEMFQQVLARRAKEVGVPPETIEEQLREGLIFQGISPPARSAEEAARIAAQMLSD